MVRRNSSMSIGALLAATLGLAACTADEIPKQLAPTPAGDGPLVRHKLYPEDLTSLPLPNDLLAISDPSSPSGLRLNIGEDAPSPIESALRHELNRLDGWGLFAPISVSFEPAEDEADTALDLLELRARLASDSLDPSDDSVYLVNLLTGTPVPLELGPGSFQSLARDKNLFPHRDPRRLEPAVEIETADERADLASGQVDTALTDYTPAIDTDFDGWLDRPNLLTTTLCASQVRVANGEITESVRDACIADNLTPWYERENDTLVVRPVVPLEPRTRYAVVLTDRLVDRSGSPVRSPFSAIYHPAQRQAAQRIEAILGNTKAKAWYGDLAGTGLERIAFLWSFTTGDPTDDLRSLRDGLYGKGPYAQLEASYPAELVASRVVGPVPQAVLDDGGSQPQGWRESDACAPIVERPFVVDAAVAAASVEDADLEDLGLRSESERRQLVESLRRLDHLVIADFITPFLIAGGASSRDPIGGFHLDAQAGRAHATTDHVQAWLFVPPTIDGKIEPPFDVALYAHASGGSVLDALPLAGAFSAQGIATVAYNAPWHGPGAKDRKLISVLTGGCYARGSTAANRTRTVDLDGDGDGDDELGARVATGNVHHGRDVVRQAVVDGLQLLRALGQFDGSTHGQDFDDDGEADLAGDFDADGKVDLGGPDVRYTAWGQSLGGHVVTLLGPLQPRLSAIAAVGSWGSLIDGWTRTGSELEHTTFFGAWLGPWIFSVPRGELEDDESNCEPNDLSLRIAGLVGANIVETEFHCLALSRLPGGGGLPNGGTVVLTNATRGERRCARTGPAGRFRVAFPADVGDALSLAIFGVPDAVATYSPGDECPLATSTAPIAEVFTWGSDPDQVLTSPVAGAGLKRGTPQLRRLMELARHVTSPAEASSFAGHFALDPIPDVDGGSGKPTAALLVAPLAAREIPVDVQVATARAMGLVPFLPPDASSRWPQWSEYATPKRLFTELSGVTPNRMLIGSSVLEGLPYLERAVPAGDCSANEIPAETAPECHAPCTKDSDCFGSQTCDLTAGALCRAPSPDPAVCRQAPVDIDAHDEGGTRFGEREAPTPLRLVRIARRVAESSLDKVWEPRLVGTPRGPDLGAWAADKKTLALVMPYLDPNGRDTLGASNPCAAFDTDSYVLNLIGRFLASGGLDPYHVSHPSTHHCLEDSSCPFFE